MQKTRISTSCHDTKRERPRPTPAGSRESNKVRHVQERARREVDLSLGYLEHGSKSGLNGSLRLFSCNLWIILNAFIFIKRNRTQDLDAKTRTRDWSIQ